MARFRLLAGPVPLHHQVYLDLRAALEAGEWRPGDRLPPERELAERYGCSLITVRRALGDLARERRLERTRGRGTFVTRPRSTSTSTGSMSFTEEIQRLGHDPATRVVTARTVAARRGRRGGARDRDRRVGGPSRTAADGRRRAAAPGAGLPARGAVSRPPRRRPRGRLAVRAARRALRHPRRPRPGVARADRPPARARPSCSASSPQAGAAHRRPGLRPPRGGRSSSPARSSGATGRATTWSGSSSAPAPDPTTIDGGAVARRDRGQPADTT